MTNSLPTFQQYQQEFCLHLRDPLNNPRPKNVPVARMAVYKEIVFNNLFESVSACFPIAQKVLGKRAWLKLCKAFMREHSADSPIFREIPQEFLAFLATQADLPPYLSSLCHYEWIELRVATMPVTEIDKDRLTQAEDLLSGKPVFTPTMQLLSYNYAVHKISPRHKPQDQTGTQLLVFRNADEQVKFIEINPVTYRLIELLSRKNITGKQALTLLAGELNYSDAEKLMHFGKEILDGLKNQGVISLFSRN